MTAVGLVLGGGGLVGQAFHAGVLAALEHDLGWDPRTAEVIVGSSAGAVTGALLRAGVGATDLAAYFAGAPEEAMSRRELPLPHFTPLGWRSACHWQTPRHGSVRRCARLPWRHHPMASLLAMVPAGQRDVTPYLRSLRRYWGRDWPPGRLLVTATRRRDARRTVLSAAAPGHPALVDAVAASCAVPGYFRPVTINGEAFVDGGLTSPTNADLLRFEPVDLAVVVSPLSTHAHVGVSVDALARRVASYHARREVTELQENGLAAFVLEPGPEAVAAMGHDLMSADACADTVREAFLDVGRDAAAQNASLSEAVGRRHAA